MKANITLVIKNPLLKSGLQAMLTQNRHEVVLASPSSDHFREFQDTDILLFELADEKDLYVLNKIRSSIPRVKVLNILTSNNYGLVSKALGLGCKGCLTEKGGKDEIGFAIQSILKGDKYVTSAISLKLFDRLNLLHTPADLLSTETKPLNQKEQDVLEMIMSGQSDRDIAHRLFTTKRNIEAIRKQLMEKIGAANNWSLMVFYLNKELFGTPMEVSR